MSSEVTSEDYGRYAYNAYCASTGGRSAVSGAELPSWDEQRADIRKAWERAAAAVCSAALKDFAELVDRGPDFPMNKSIFSSMARERAGDADVE